MVNDMAYKTKKRADSTHTNFKTDNATALKIALLRKFFNVSTSVLMFELVDAKYKEHKNDIEEIFNTKIPLCNDNAID